MCMCGVRALSTIRIGSVHWFTSLWSQGREAPERHRGQGCGEIRRRPPGAALSPLSLDRETTAVSNTAHGVPGERKMLDQQVRLI